ncbi:GYD domain-containing protein [Candidatus Uhrbacteria bacterium]|nr:GYD domain-containing protein [Candidatus Uhrbacteria bacterium]
MAHYIVLGQFTEQGIKAVKDTQKRAKAFRDAAKGMGVTIKDIYWTLGTYDVVATADASSEEAMASLMLKMGSLGNVKSQTLRAFSEGEMGGIVAKV